MRWKVNECHSSNNRAADETEREAHERQDEALVQGLKLVYLQQAQCLEECAAW